MPHRSCIDGDEMEYAWTCCNSDCKRDISCSRDSTRVWLLYAAVRTFWSVSDNSLESTSDTFDPNAVFMRYWSWILISIEIILYKLSSGIKFSGKHSLHWPIFHLPQVWDWFWLHRFCCKLSQANIFTAPYHNQYKEPWAPSFWLKSCYLQCYAG